MVSPRTTNHLRRVSIRPLQLIIGAMVAGLGLAGLVAGILLANEPYPYDAALAVGMPVGLLIGTGGLAILLVGVWLSVAALGRRTMQDR